jgi:hypothetical protein
MKILNAGLIVAALAALAAAACTSTNPLRASVRDASGKPIPNAIFYAEAYDSGGTFDFVWAKTGENGEIPPTTIRWKRGAKLALAAFAEGKRPIAVYDELGRVKADGVDLPLSDLPETGLKWEPRLAKLSFPFEGQPELAERIAASENADLRRAFRDAYTLIGSQVLPEEQIKIDALNRIENR